MAINLNLELTDRCNLKCRMCGQFFVEDVHGAAETFMEWATWKSLVDGLADYPDEIHLCPHWLGEPTLHPEFDRFIRYAFEQNRGNRLFRHFKLHTNAVIFGAERAQNLLECAALPGREVDTFRWVHFSIDALHRPTYRYVKGGDHRDRVFKNIETFLQKRQERGQFFPRVTVAFIVMPENRGEAAGFLHYWREILRHYGSEPNLSFDWPHELKDTVYIRRLNTEDQASADILHRDVLVELGLLPAGSDWRLTGESF